MRGRQKQDLQFRRLVPLRENSLCLQRSTGGEDSSLMLVTETLGSYSKKPFFGLSMGIADGEGAGFQ